MCQQRVTNRMFLTPMKWSGLCLCPTATPTPTPTATPTKSNQMGTSKCLTEAKTAYLTLILNKNSHSQGRGSVLL